MKNINILVAAKAIQDQCDYMSDVIEGDACGGELPYAEYNELQKVHAIIKSLAEAIIKNQNEIIESAKNKKKEDK